VGFYSDQPEQSLRFGDVVTGFQAAVPHIHRPGPDAANLELSILVTRPQFFVVMTPCCSIEDKSISLAPLLAVRPAFFKNQFLREDLTRINSPEIPPEKSVPSEAWEKFTPEQKAATLAQAPGYVFLDCFVYESNPLFPEYELKQRGWSEKSRHRMVDFKQIFRVECGLVARDKPAPEGTKMLQLNAWARGLLRDKLAKFFSRVPEEDVLELASS
jgi:hypothetical protein